MARMTKSRFVKRIAKEIIEYSERYERDLRELWDEIYDEIERQVIL